ncbi:MAG: DUF3137 domain-containing protein [Bacteroidia bacterium]
MTAAQSERLSNKLAEFEKFRKKAYRSYKLFNGITWPFRIAYVAGIALLVIGTLLPFLMPVFLPFIIIAGALFILQIILHNWIFRDPLGRFEERFKQELMTEMMGEIYPEFTYKPTAKVKDEAVIFSRLFGKKISKMYGEDYFEGKLKGIGMRFSELVVKKKKYGMKEFMGDVAGELVDAILGGEGDYGDDVDEHLVTVFKGLFFHLGFHVDFKGSIIIQSRQSKWRKVFDKTYRSNRQLIESGDAAFDRAFQIYVSPDLSLDYVLTPAMRTNLLKLQAEVAPDLAASIRDGQMFVAIPWKKDLLEAELDKGIPTLDDFATYMEEVDLIKEVVTHMY